MSTSGLLHLVHTRCLLALFKNLSKVPSKYARKLLHNSKSWNLGVGNKQ
jgi:hypothetical protein